jgi:hypothetical protein
LQRKRGKEEGLRGSEMAEIVENERMREEEEKRRMETTGGNERSV